MRSAVFVAVFLPVLLAAQSTINGRWRWAATGGGQQIVMDFKTSGTGVSGTITMAQATLDTPVTDGKAAYFLSPDTPNDKLRELYFPPVVFPIEAGRISGNTLTFTQMSGKLKLQYTGRIDGDRIQFTREYRATVGDPSVVGVHAVTFTVERVR